MPRIRAIPPLLLLLFLATIATAQRNDTTAAVINFQQKDNQLEFNSSLRSLHQIAGAPEAFYSYFWEFGDGSFSFEEKPRHTYKDTGTFDIRLFATNNYDDGKPPPTRPKPVRVNSNSNLASNNNPSFFKQGGTIEMKVNRMPKADEDVVLIMGYRNENKNTPLNGSLVLFYNEKQFQKKNFDLTEERVYNNEKKSSINSIAANFPEEEIIGTGKTGVLSGPNATTINSTPSFYAGKFSALLSAKQKMFKQNAVWHFENLQMGEEKYFFVTLHTTPEMIKDTNAIITLTGMFVPGNTNGEIEEYSLELQIVASHDPNRMMLKNQRLNYRFTGRKKEMQYRIRFQNTGRGAAQNVKVGIGVPSMLDSKSLEILDYYPKCVFCDSARIGQSCLDTIIGKDSIWFVFKNIYLPGLRQQGFTDPDSTIGFVKYRMHFSKQLKKLPFESNAAIVFNDQKPIYTNSPKGFFKPGNSPAVIIGYNKLLGNVSKNNNNVNEDYWMIGGSISPYSPYKKYLQAEAFVGYKNFPEEFVGAQTANSDTVIGSNTYLILARQFYAKSKVIKLDLVPLELRYNIIDLVGVGAGTLISFDAYTRTSVREVLRMVQPPNPTAFTMTKNYTTTKWFGHTDVALFGDVQFGKVRVGPVLGVRYLHYFSIVQNRLFIYAAWRL